MIRTCTLRDFDPWFRKDWTGYNKVGYVTKHETVIYQMRWHLVELPLAEVAKKPHKIFAALCPPEKEDLVESFFTENVRNDMLFQLGMQRLCRGDWDYFTNPIRLPKLSPISESERQIRWNNLLRCARPADFVQVLDESSLLSRMIAKVEQGTWSHTAIYAGHGNVLEAITAGVVERKLDVYQDRHHRIGLYRHRDITDKSRIGMISYGRSMIGAKYGWSMAAKLGLKKVFRFGGRQLGEITPNEINVMNNLELVAIV